MSGIASVWRVSRCWYLDRLDPESGKTTRVEYGDTVDFATAQEARDAVKRFRILPGEWLPRHGHDWWVSDPMEITGTARPKARSRVRHA